MSSPYIGEIRMFAGNFAPVGWMFCDGSLIPISENDTLFNLIGTTYGGDGQSTFALPDLRSRVPVHVGTVAGQTFQLAETGGVETVTLNTNQIPNHNHPAAASNEAGNQSGPANNFWAKDDANKVLYTDSAPSALMNAGIVQLSGGSQPHDNMLPFQAVNFIISMFGIFPTQT